MRPPESECICPKAMQTLPRWEGVNMGRALLRTATAAGCPVHDSCHGYTKAERTGRPSWSVPYCPIHGTHNCPAKGQ